jgi:hypothetical protein
VTGRIAMYLIALLCLSPFLSADMDYRIRGGLETFEDEAGIDSSISIHLLSKLLNQDSDDFSAGIVLSGMYSGSDTFSITGFGPGVDVGYIIALGVFRLTPSAEIGYLWGSSQSDTQPQISLASAYAYPHLLLELDPLPFFSIGLDGGYRFTFANIPPAFEPLAGFIINLSLTYKNRNAKSAASDSKKNDSAADDAKTKNSNSDTVNIQKSSDSEGDDAATAAMIETEDKAVINAKALVSSGDKGKAIKILEAFLKKNPDNARVKEILNLLKSPNIDIEKLK